MPTITQWKYFLEASKQGNLTLAAKELFISQQALSKAITSIETALDCVLFNRTEKGVELTPAGKKIHPVVSTMIEKYGNYEAIIASLAAESHSTLSLLFEHSFMQFMISADLIGRIGNIIVKTDFSSGFQDCCRKVNAGIVDMALVHKPVATEGLVYIPLYSEPLGIIMPKRNRLAKKAELHLDDLKGENQVMPNVEASIVHDYIAACVDEGFYPKFVFETPSLEMALRNIQDKNCIMIAAVSGIKNMPEDITSRPLIHPHLMMEVGFLVRPNYKENAIVSSFIRATMNVIS